MKNYTTAMNAYTTAQRAAGLSPNSIASYTQALRFYGTFCEEHSYDPETPQAVLAYKEALFSGGNAQSTIKLRMIHLKEFFAFCAELGYAETNPCAKFVTKVGHVRLVTGRDGIRSHAIRHASASYMLSNGMSLEDIQALLGHSDVKTTQIYSERLFPTAPTEKANIVFSTVAAG